MPSVCGIHGGQWRHTTGFSCSGKPKVEVGTNISFTITNFHVCYYFLWLYNVRSASTNLRLAKILLAYQILYKILHGWVTCCVEVTFLAHLVFIFFIENHKRSLPVIARKWKTLAKLKFLVKKDVKYHLVEVIIIT